ncbi:trans-aconitate 2-methyltransferase [Caballeronia mineralivorans]|jgi:trans-aconitate 2-methyltransferase|uniref:trans-aconitate 2-methyltransferase n=1 Tax=Caballeronia mineralivorans TaxID=2010198 RepID=UPI0023F253EF|nr:trans-aconitate 2-methyltransferase [Caballeronia mineralivorans]MDB5780149.1 tam [Caballeronia mineralivorans]
MSWSAKQYVVFESERTRPIRDLLAAVPDIDARSVVDIGCGPGNSTEVLMTRFPNAAISGFDSSPDMIEAARKRLPQVHFETADIQAWNAPGPFDVILANAVLQWLPDHASLLPALVAKLSPRGSLAIQMPDNLDEPAHSLMREIAASGPWASKLSGATKLRTPRASASWYYELLRSCSAKADVWRTTYHHALAGGASAVVEWFKGSGLRPFLEPLTEDERLAFLDRYKTAVGQAYPALPDGTVLLPFPRLFIVASR